MWRCGGSQAPGCLEEALVRSRTSKIMKPGLFYLDSVIKSSPEWCLSI